MSRETESPITAEMQLQASALATEIVQMMFATMPPGAQADPTHVAVLFSALANAVAAIGATVLNHGADAELPERFGAMITAYLAQFRRLDAAEPGGREGLDGRSLH